MYLDLHVFVMERIISLYLVQRVFVTQLIIGSLMDQQDANATMFIISS